MTGTDMIGVDQSDDLTILTFGQKLPETVDTAVTGTDNGKLQFSLTEHIASP